MGEDLDRRRFVLRTTAGFLGWLAAGRGRPGAACGGPRGETVGDRLWLWGHPAGAHTQSPEQWGLSGRSQITPAAAAKAMGIPNVVMVRYGLEPKPPFEEYAEPLKKQKRLVWSIEGGGGADVDAVLDLARRMPNLEGVIIDDYFGRVRSLVPRAWLAANGVRFPVTLTFRFQRPVAVERLELVQSAWLTGDYRSGDFAVDLDRGEGQWVEAATGTLPNAAMATAEVKLPGEAVGRLRVRILSTHDTAKAMSCGLTRVRFWVGERGLTREGIEVSADSEYPGHPAASVLADLPPADEGPFSLAALERLRKRLDAGPRPLDLWVVLYTGEFELGPLLKPHLELCDVVTMWTWRAEDLARLEESFARFEGIVGSKRKVLGLYMWDYGAKRPMPLDLMKRQCELGLRWLREGRIEGMIFLASCICDLKLEAVEWTRQWIAANAATPLGPGAAPR
jgi:hypothetical protein